jgi:hypothetical protein
MRWQKHHHETNHTNEIVVIQVSAFVQKFNIGEAQEQAYTGNPVIEAQRDKQSR